MALIKCLFPCHKVILAPLAKGSGEFEWNFHLTLSDHVSIGLEANKIRFAIKVLLAQISLVFRICFIILMNQAINKSINHYTCFPNKSNDSKHV